MKREIVFRGKLIYNGEWIYGSYACYPDADGEHHMILKSRNGELCFFEVDPETVGQYTGCKDSEGNRVFEDDVLLFEYEDIEANGEKNVGRDIYKVDWDEDGLFVLENADGVIDPDPIGDYICEGFTIVGNIHDDPDWTRLRFEN